MDVWPNWEKPFLLQGRLDGSARATSLGRTHALMSARAVLFFAAAYAVALGADEGRRDPIDYEHLRYSVVRIQAVAIYVSSNFLKVFFELLPMANFWANFERLVLGCIEADFCN